MNYDPPIDIANEEAGMDELKEFPCYNCTAKDPKHEDHCEFAWDDYNYGKTVWDCLGAK